MILDGESIRGRLAQALDLLLAPDPGQFPSDDGEERDERNAVSAIATYPSHGATP